ncbi:MAG TPA: DUF1836 domain-containing protein [Candidatus Dorea intestinavium]|nr:DUF1836 domain-containing protein [Candidatus Dorea intestinavium]
MKNTLDTLLQEVLNKLDSLEYIHLRDIPDIDLYMDQVTTFMDTHLSSTKRYPEDKVLTKTMINNYAKNNLLPPPQKKKYSQDHLLILTFIYYFKNIISIKDIETILNPLSEKYFQKDGEITLASIYENVRLNAKDKMNTMPAEMEELFEKAKAKSKDGEEELEDLNLFYIICQLSIDIYVKKLVLERLVDEIEDDKKKK